MSALLSETVISLTEAAKLSHVTRAAVYSWATRGLHGIKLEATYSGNSLKTSKEALARFHQLVNTQKGM